MRHRLTSVLVAAITAVAVIASLLFAWYVNS